MRRIRPVTVRILMLRKGIRHDDLMKRFQVSKPAISMALKGIRPALLRRIYDHLRSS